MIKHVVLARLRSDATEAEIAAVWAGLADLVNTCPGLLDAHFGADNSPEGLARGYTHAFVMTFENAAARDAYLPHPAHQAAGARLVAATEGGVDGLCVMDF